MPRLEDTDTHRRLAAMRRRLNDSRKITRPSVLILANSRRAIIHDLNSVVRALSEDINLLPPRVEVAGKNLSSELRYARNSATSIIQGLQDRVIKRRDAATYAEDLQSRLRECTRLLDIVITQADMRRPIIKPTAPPRVEAKPPHRPSIIVAASKYKKFTDAFGDLDKLVRDLAEAEAQKKRAENAETPAPRPDIYSDDPDEDIDQTQVIDNNANQPRNPRLDADAQHAQHVLQEAEKILRKNYRKIPRDELYSFFRAPLLVTTQNYVPDTVLKHAKVPYERVFKVSNQAGYIPGLGSGGGVVAPVVIHDQHILGIPLAAALHRPTFEKAMRTILPALTARLGGMVPMPIGKKATGMRDLTPGRSLDKSNNAQQELLRQYSDRLNDITAAKKDDDDPKKEPTRQEGFESQRRHLIGRQAAEQAKRDVARMASNLDQSRRWFFASKHYPGMAFIWLVLRPTYQELNKLVLLDVDFPFYTPANAEPLHKQAREENTEEKRRRLMQQRETLRADYDSTLDKIKKQIATWRQQMKELESEREALEHVRTEAVQLLNGIRDKNSPAYRAAFSNAQKIGLEISSLDGQIDAIRDGFTAARKEIAAEKDRLNKRIEAARQARLKKK